MIQIIQAMMAPMIGSRKNSIMLRMNITMPPVTLAYSRPKGPNKKARIKAMPALLGLVTITTGVGKEWRCSIKDF
jgi:hypothetical protein